MAEHEPQEEATTPEPEYSAADALKSLESDETEEVPEVTADEDSTEDDSETDETEEDPEVPDNEDDEDEELDLVQQLRLENADQLPEEVVKRFDQQVKGLAKKDRQIAENLETLEVAKGVERALFQGTPEQAEQALQALADAVRKHHGHEEKVEPVETDGTWEYDGKTFYSEREVELYQKNQELERKLEQKDPEIEEIKAERRMRKEQETLQNWADQNSQRIIAKVAAKANGWGVTKDQIIEAVRLDKAGMEADPVMAMKRAFPDAYADHRAGRPKPPVKDMITGTQAKGFSIPDNPDEYTAAHALMEVSS